MQPEPQLSPHALAVLEKRFLQRDAQGQLVEDAGGLFRRVAKAIAAVDALYGDFRSEESEQIFFDLMASFQFLPNSPTLMNAGAARGQLAGCFVLPVEDSMESIYGTLRDVALIQKSGGGTGFSFSRLRPRGDYIASTRGLSSGPISFMRLYDYSTQINRLGGTRAGANMAVLRHDHPDIHEFVNSKQDPESLTSFNISVMATDEFMRAAERGESIELRFETSRGQTNARALFDEIVSNAWETGDPGLLFYDRINAANPTPQLGAIEATNPCGEQPLLAYESCNLGSINVSKFVRAGTLDYDALAVAVRHGVHFLDNVLDANWYPVEAVRKVTLGNRKVGLGIMGFADVLVALGTPYASEAAVALACGADGIHPAGGQSSVGETGSNARRVSYISQQPSRRPRPAADAQRLRYIHRAHRHHQLAGRLLQRDRALFRAELPPRSDRLDQGDRRASRAGPNARRGSGRHGTGAAASTGDRASRCSFRTAPVARTLPDRSRDRTGMAY